MISWPMGSDLQQTVQRATLGKKVLPVDSTYGWMGRDIPHNIRMVDLAGHCLSNSCYCWALYLAVYVHIANWCWENVLTTRVRWVSRSMAGGRHGRRIDSIEMSCHLRIDPKTGMNFLYKFLGNISKLSTKYYFHVFTLDHALFCEMPRKRLFILLISEVQVSYFVYIPSSNMWCDVAFGMHVFNWTNVPDIQGGGGGGVTTKALKWWRPAHTNEGESVWSQKGVKHAHALCLLVACVLLQLTVWIACAVWLWHHVMPGQPGRKIMARGTESWFNWTPILVCVCNWYPNAHPVLWEKSLTMESYISS